MPNTASMQQTRAAVQVNSFIRSVYNWMAGGLALSGIIAYMVSQSEEATRIVFGNPLVLIGLIIAELALVFIISGRIHKLQAATATGLFMLYAALNGVTLSFVFLYYSKTSIVSTFFICAATFIGCSIYGMTTKKDLTSLGGFLMMGLIGIIIASVVNMFIASSAMQMIISYIGVFVFIGLTAYDTQQLKNMALSQPADASAAAVQKGAILGALKLYLDFINLFLFLLRIFGSARE